MTVLRNLDLSVNRRQANFVEQPLLPALDMGVLHEVLEGNLSGDVVENPRV